VFAWDSTVYHDGGSDHGSNIIGCDGIVGFPQRHLHSWQQRLGVGGGTISRVVVAVVLNIGVDSIIDCLTDEFSVLVARAAILQW